jgi:hypothetical protein
VIVMTIRKTDFLFVIVMLMAVITLTAVMTDKTHADGEFKRTGDMTPLVFDSGNCPGKYTYSASNSIVSAESGDSKVFIANIDLPYRHYTEADPESNYYELGQDGQCEILPVGEGTATLTLKDGEGKIITETVTVDKSYFQAFLESKLLNDEGPGIIHSKIDPSGEEYEYINNTVAYGESRFRIISRFGTKVTVKFKGKTYKEESGTDGMAWFKIPNKLYKLKTKGKFTIEFGPASITKSFKIASDSSISPNYIKPKASKGSVRVYRVHKGDYIKIKVGKRNVKTAKFKKAEGMKTVKFKKYKMKKKTKVTAVL